MRPWAERALTLDIFAYHAESRFGTPNAAVPPVPVTLDDKIWTFGAGLRAQWDSLAIDAGVYQERHDHALADGTGVHALSQYEEISYVIFPWLVPAVRVEVSQVQPAGESSIHDVRITPGIAFLVRANGAPNAGWGQAGGFAAPTPGTSTTEIESIIGNLAFAF
jgi:hypothetical protein